MIKKILETILLKDIWTALLVGLRSCLKKPVTQKLENIKRSDNFRRFFELNLEKCITCRLCESICPCHAIKIKSKSKYEFDESKCAYCRLCQKTCPKNAIRLVSLSYKNNHIKM